MTVKYSLVIPCYNEENNIDPLINKAKKIIDNEHCEIVLVNNGSYDRTKEKIDSYSKKYSNIKCVDVEKNIGFGFGVFEGLRNTSGIIIGYTHADLQTDPNDFLKAKKWIEKNDHLNKEFFIKGRRNKRKLIDRLFTNLMSVFETILFGKYMYDIGAQPVIFHRDFLNKLKLHPNNFMIELYLYYVAKKNNYLIHRMDVDFPERLRDHGSNDSLIQKIKNSLIVLFYSIVLRVKLFLK